MRGFSIPHCLSVDRHISDDVGEQNDNKQGMVDNRDNEPESRSSSAIATPSPIISLSRRNLDSTRGFFCMHICLSTQNLLGTLRVRPKDPYLQTIGDTLHLIVVTVLLCPYKVEFVLLKAEIVFFDHL